MVGFRLFDPHVDDVFVLRADVADRQGSQFSIAEPADVPDHQHDVVALADQLTAPVVTSVERDTNSDDSGVLELAVAARPPINPREFSGADQALADLVDLVRDELAGDHAGVIAAPVRSASVARQSSWL